MSCTKHTVSRRHLVQLGAAVAVVPLSAAAAPHSEIMGLCAHYWPLVERSGSGPPPGVSEDNWGGESLEHRCRAVYTLAERIIKMPATAPREVAEKLKVSRHDAGYEGGENAEPCYDGPQAGRGMWAAIEDLERMAGFQHESAPTYSH